MSFKTRSLVSLALCGVLAGATQAAPVSLSVTGFSFTSGAGYGIDDNEKFPNLLDVRFTATLPATSFTLNGGDSITLTLGTVQMFEPNAHGAIVDPAETDGLGVSGLLGFGGVPGSQAFAATTTPFPGGSVSDGVVDLKLTWAPLLLDLGGGNLLDIVLNPLELAGQQATSQTATLTLRGNTQNVVVPAAVPEPGSWALAALGLVVLGLARRRR